MALHLGELRAARADLLLLRDLALARAQEALPLEVGDGLRLDEIACQVKLNGCFRVNAQEALLLGTSVIFYV